MAKRLLQNLWQLQLLKSLEMVAMVLTAKKSPAVLFPKERKKK